MAYVARSVSPVSLHQSPVRRSLASRSERMTQPFGSAEEAWFWTMSALTARREGARSVAHAGLVVRPCEPDDVVRCLDALYQARRIDLAQARVLRVWGERGMAPDPRVRGEQAESEAWRAAVARLEWPLRAKGIVGSER